MNAQLAATVLAMLLAGATGANAKSLLEFEKRHITEIAQLAARERCTILFEVGGYDEHAVGYAKDGHIYWIDSRPVSSQCRRHSALSPDGLRVACVSDGGARHCRIDTYDTATAVRRELIEVEADPGEISRSWDNARIAFFERGISAVAVQDTVRKLLVPQMAFDGWSRMQWYPIQWLHNGKDLVLELSKDVPIGRSGRAFTDQSSLFVESGGHIRLIAIGRDPLFRRCQTGSPITLPACLSTAMGESRRLMRMEQIRLF